MKLDEACKIFFVCRYNVAIKFPKQFGIWCFTNTTIKIFDTHFEKQCIEHTVFFYWFLGTCRTKASHPVWIGTFSMEMKIWYAWWHAIHLCFHDLFCCDVDFCLSFRVLVHSFNRGKTKQKKINTFWTHRTNSSTKTEKSCANLALALAMDRSTRTQTLRVKIKA